MKIFWHKRAVTALRQVEDYVMLEFGEKLEENL